MNQIFKLTALASLCMIGVSPIQADQTNLVQKLTIQLVGLKEGAARTSGNLVTKSVIPVTLGTREVINNLGTATGNTFSRAAQLVVITPLSYGALKFAVRDGGTSVDVTSFFALDQVSSTVESSELNTRTGRSSATEYSIQRLALRDSDGYAALTTHFDVMGVTVQTSLNSVRQGWSTDTDANVSGAGDRNGDILILQGVFSFSGRTLEVVADGPAPGV